MLSNEEKRQRTRANKAKWNAANPEKCRAYGAKHRAANREKLAAKAKLRYRRERDGIQSTAKAHPLADSAPFVAWLEAHTDELCAAIANRVVGDDR